MNSFNGFANSIRNVYYVIQNYVNYVYNFPAVDASLVFYYPLDSSNGNTRTANYASGLPVYDASMMGLAMNTYDPNNFVTGLGDLSLNNTMGWVATSYVQTDTSFNLVPSRGLSISLWFSCSAQDVCGTLISLYEPNIDSSIRIGLYGSKLFSGYGASPLTYTVSTTGNPTINTSISGFTQYLFTNPTGTFNINNISKNIDIHIFAVGGGGGGGITPTAQNQVGGGGGGGGVIQVYKTTKSDSSFNIIVGNGGSNATTYQAEYASPGGDTIVKLFNNNVLVTAVGGGPGGKWDSGGKTGGSCSGNPPGRSLMPEITLCTNSIDWSLVFKAGNKGGSGIADNAAGGGGGAYAVGDNATSTAGGNGGNGITPSIVNNIQVFTSNTYAGGGGGGNRLSTTQSSGGIGGGGKGCSTSGYSNKNGTDNTGGGGGGGREDYSAVRNYYGGDGGSGICIISIPTSG